MLELKEYADAPLDAALFAPPPDYKEISMKEFETIIADDTARMNLERIPPEARFGLKLMNTSSFYRRGLERLLDDLQSHP